MLTRLMPESRVKVLAFLLSNATDNFHLREITRLMQLAERDLRLARHTIAADGPEPRRTSDSSILRAAPEAVPVGRRGLEDR